MSQSRRLNSDRGEARFMLTFNSQLDGEGSFKRACLSPCDVEVDHYRDDLIASPLFLGGSPAPVRGRAWDGLRLCHEILRGDGIGVEGRNLSHKIVLLLAGVASRSVVDDVRVIAKIVRVAHRGFDTLA